MDSYIFSYKFDNCTKSIYSLHEHKWKINYLLILSFLQLQYNIIFWVLFSKNLYVLKIHKNHDYFYEKTYIKISKMWIPQMQDKPRSVNWILSALEIKYVVYNNVVCDMTLSFIIAHIIHVWNKFLLKLLPCGSYIYDTLMWYMKIFLFLIRFGVM